MSKYFSIIIFLLLTLSGFSDDKQKELFKLSNTKFDSGDYVGAFNVTMNALSIAEKNKDCYWISFGYLHLGGLNYYLKKKELALQNYYVAMRYADSCRINKFDYRIYHDIGVIYVEQDLVDSALKYMNRTVERLKGSKKHSYLSNTYCVLSVLYLGKKNDFKKAEEYINEAEKQAILSKKEGDMMFVEMKKGGFYNKKNDLNNALKHYQIAYAYACKSNVVEEKLYSLGCIANILARMGNKEAADYYSKYGTLKDSVFNAETANKLANYKVKYQTEKKEQENKILQQENNLKQSQLETRNRTIIILVFAIVLIAIIIVWRINASKLKKKQLELESSQKIQKEKERISRDLHDNVGGQLSYILYSLDDIKSEDKQKREELSKNINESVRNVIQNLRETIWAINDESLTINDLSDKLKVYARSMFKNSNTKIIFSENIESDILLNSLVGLNLYRICQEIINNAFKYSKATELKITITSQEKASIVIADNGIGFDLNEQSEGFGLKNINDRAQEIKASVTINASKNQGVTYTIVV